MNIENLLAYTAVAALTIASPGPAVLLALRNSVAYGVRSVIWSSLGNVSGIFCLSGAAMLGLGVLLMSSAILFGVVKLLGVLYLFYIGVRHLLGKTSVVNPKDSQTQAEVMPSPVRLYREAFFLATTNPKPILFFTALFPQFIDVQASLLVRFLTLTGIFMCLSFMTLIAYALIGLRARTLMLRPRFSKWMNRVIGCIFMSFGAALFTLRRVVT
jgi:threonine/homoserine/homoserine lactone efflux protein